MADPNPADRDSRSTWVGEGVGRVAAPLRERVVEIVRQAIFDFKLRPGERLIERELIQQLGVSRTTVRDVLARLAAEGLVTIIPQKGAIVSVLTLEEAADIYEMRASLEGLAVRRFVERASPDVLAELRGTLAEIERTSVDEVDTGEALAAKDRFYEVLLQGARSSRLTNILTSLQGQVRLLRATSLSVPGRAVEAAAEIRAVIEAIEAGDAEAGATACATHVHHAAETGLTRLAELLDGDQSNGAPAPIDEQFLESLGDFSR
jgi:DNA-binding GntR family transcriptional regulator